MRHRFPRRARPLVAVALVSFAAFGGAAAAHMARKGPDLYARLAVIQVCRSEDEAVRRDAIAMLRKLGPRAVPAVVERARDGEVPDELFFVLAEVAGPEDVGTLAGGIRGGSEARRIMAAKGLARIGTRDAALALGPALADPKLEVRLAAREGLRGHGSDVLQAGVTEALGNPAMIPEFIRQVLVEAGVVGAAVEPVIESLRSGDAIRIGNALYLARHLFADYPPGKERESALVGALAGVLDRLDMNAQQVAVEVLASLDFEGRTAALCGIARNRRYAEHVRVMAIQGLALRRDTTAVLALEELMKQPRFMIRDASSATLGRIGTAEDAERWLRLVEAGGLEFEARELYLRAVGEAGTAAMTARLLALLVKSETPTTLEAIRRVASKDPRASAPAFMAFLDDVAPQHLSWANERLQDLTWHRSGLTELPRTMEEYVRLRDAIHKEWRRWWAANGALTAEEWRAAGVTEIETDLASPAAEVRFGAISRLIRLDPPDLEPRLLARLDEPEEYVWARVVEVLLARAAPATREHLRAQVGTGSGRAAARAARILGMIEEKAAVGEILRAAERPETAVRRDCAYALGRLGDARAIPALLRLLKDGPAAVAAEARISLETIGDRTIEPEMIAGLASGDREYRLACASILGRVGGPGSIRPLVALFSDPDEILQGAAFRAVRSLTGRQASLHPTEAEIRAWEKSLEYRRP
ncbi:MAG: HEAT repeat domain-containing protein [Planctomycetes bacterium]|nr:HEAT repeat domain-containing protein [Planctomycetota bacterium]